MRYMIILAAMAVILSGCSITKVYVPDNDEIEVVESVDD